MTSQTPELDEIDCRLISILRQNARISFRELSKLVHLSPAATTARVHSLEADGIIVGYTARIDGGLTGRSTRAIIRLTSNQATTPSVDGAEKFGETHPAVRSVYRVLGDCDLIFDVEATGLPELDEFVHSLGRYGVTNTTMVVSVETKDAPISPA